MNAAAQPRRTALRLVAGLCLVASARAQAPSGPSVAYGGRMGERALLLIDGQPVTLAVGASARGVRLLRLDDEAAVIEQGGQTLRVPMGGTPIRLGANTPAAATEIVLTADSGGHFIGMGSINGRPVRFMVDTGATLVSMSQAEAQRLGLDLRSARRGMAQTANGAVPVHELTLAEVRLGEVAVQQVGALVSPGSMPYVLLGNSFLTRFQMRRDNDQLRLQRRP